MLARFEKCDHAEEDPKADVYCASSVRDFVLEQLF
jgi:hypothetical protein